MSDRFGTWQLDALVAVGGLGEIWRASRDAQETRQTCALKRIHTHLVRNDDAREQFAREQQLATTLPPHPNVVRGLEAGALDERSYLAMELVLGEDLRRIVAPSPSPTAPKPARAPLDRNRALDIVLAACDAASHLHANGWVHGDINPSNLVIGDRVVLIDLGIARELGRPGTPRGTHAYMAPEQIRGEAWTAATDVFALGVVLWELLAGARLFHRGPSYLSMQAVMEFEPPALADRSLDALVHAALAKNPARRLATPADLADQLRGS